MREAVVLQGPTAVRSELGEVICNVPVEQLTVVLLPHGVALRGRGGQAAVVEPHCKYRPRSVATQEADEPEGRAVIARQRSSLGAKRQVCIEVRAVLVGVAGDSNVKQGNRLDDCGGAPEAASD